MSETKVAPAAGATGGAATGGIPIDMASIPWHLRWFEFWQAVNLFFLIPFAIFMHLIVWLQNGRDYVDVHVYLWSWNMTTNMLMTHSALYGVFVCACLFYYRQRKLLLDIKELKEDVTTLKNKRTELEGKLAKLNAAGSQILVPYRLDALVDKGLADFQLENYKPGLLQAQPRSR